MVQEYSLSQKIIRNTVFNTAGRLWAILIAIGLTPYIIRYIGVERFGIWSIVGVLTSYFGLLDFGLSTSFVKYLAEFYAKGEYGKINAVVNTGFIFYFFLAIIVLIAVFFFTEPILTLLKIPVYLRAEASFVLWLAFFIFCGSNALSVFGSIPFGLQRMDIANNVGVLISIVNLAGTIFFLKKGYGLIGLMLNNCLVFCLVSVITVIIAFRLLPALKFNPFLFDKEVFRKLMGFGYKLQISRFANMIGFQNDKLLITHFLGVGSVAFYQIGSSLLAQVRQFCLLLISALVPAASEIEARREKELLGELYLTGSKYLVFVSVPLTLFTMANAALMVSAWMGEGYHMAVWVIQILGLGYLSATVTGVASSIALGVAKPELDMKFGILMAVLNIVFNIILVVRIGFIGVIIGTSSSFLLASVYYLRLFSNYIGFPLRDFGRLLYKPFLSSVLPLLGVGVLNHFILPYVHLCSHYPRIFYLFVLGVDALFFAVTYLFFICRCKYFNAYDKALLKDKIYAIKFF